MSPGYNETEANQSCGTLRPSPRHVSHEDFFGGHGRMKRGEARCLRVGELVGAGKGEGFAGDIRGQ